MAQIINSHEKGSHYYHQHHTQNSLDYNTWAAKTWKLLCFSLSLGAICLSCEILPLMLHTCRDFIFFLRQVCIDDYVNVAFHPNAKLLGKT
jgi:hypothetical protein